MTVSTVPSAGGSGRRDPARSRYSWWGEAHPVKVLRRLRNGVLAAVAALALVCVVVAVEAHSRIETVNATRTSLWHIGAAEKAASDAAVELRSTFDNRDVNLTGTGTRFVTSIGSANSNIALAAPGIASRENGEMRFQFVLGQLATSVHLAETAVQQYEDFEGKEGYHKQADDPAWEAMTKENESYDSAAVPNTGGLIPALEDLMDHQRKAYVDQRPLLLDPVFLWSLLLVPTLGVLLCGGATAHVLARHFRRLLSPLLGAALLITVAVTVTGGVLGTCLYGRMPGENDPLPPGMLQNSDLLSRAPTLLLAASGVTSVLLAVAAVLVYFAYRPRLAEYRFGAS